MSANYFNRDGSGHSIRGQEARENGAMAWSKLPAALRRKLTAKQAESLEISFEWHHSGKYANETYVYHLPQVEAYWASIDAAEVTSDELAALANRDYQTLNLDPVRANELYSVKADAREAAEKIRRLIELGEYEGEN